MTDLIIIGIVLILMGSALVYIVRSKKSGVKCIGCSSGCGCFASEKKQQKENICCHCSPEKD